MLDASGSHAPVFLLRPRHKELELGHPLRFSPKTQTERLTDQLRQQYGYVPQPQTKPRDLRTVSAGRGLLAAYHSKTHYKTILSLEMSLHSWQQGPKESDLRERIRVEKLGQVANTGKRVLLKTPLDRKVTLINNIQKVPSTENLVLTNDQKSQLSQEILRYNDILPPRTHSPTRSRGGSSPTTYHSDFSRAQSISLSRKIVGERVSVTKAM